MADQAGGWNVVSSTPDAQPSAAPVRTTQISGGDSGGWNVVNSQPAAPTPAGYSPLFINPNTPKPKGMVQPGNVDLKQLPVINNGDGSYSTVYGTSFSDEKPGSPTYGKEVLVRGILNGKKTDDADALRREYYRTGKHLGVFDNGDNATPYAMHLHSDWEQGKIPGVQMGTPSAAAMPPGLPSPELVDQQTTQHANTLASIILQTGAPPVQQPALPLGLRTPENSPAIAAAAPTFQQTFGMDPRAMGLEAGLNLDPTGIVPGTAHAAQGLAQTLTGANMRERAGGIHKTISGAFEAATPTMAGAVAKAPIRTAISVAGGMVSQEAVEKGLTRLGLPPEYAAVAGDLVGVLVGVGTHELTGRGAAAVKAKVGPILAARAARSASPPATASITGSEPYRPATQPAQPGAAPVAADTAQTGSIPPAVDAGAGKRLRGEKYSVWQARIAELDKPARPNVEPGWNVVSSTPPGGSKEPSTIERPGVSDGKQSAGVDARAARPVDAGGTGEGAALHGAPAPGSRPNAGEATDVVIPGEDRSIPARYEVRELGDIQSSHHGQTFSANPKYEGQNERDYSKPENQQRVIEQSSEERFNPRYHISDNPDMANGPALIDEDGNALGGNSRTMHLQRVYGRDGQKAAEYRALLEKKAAQFGIDPEAVRGMKQPVLVRVATPEGLAALPGGSKWAVRKTNITGTAALSSSERAAADAGQMSPDMIGHIAGAIEDAGPDATLNDALTGKSGTVIVNRLIADGFFSEQERPGLMDGKTGVLTQSAKDRISKALLGQFFRDSDQISRTPASIRNKLERVAAPLAKVAGNSEWDITPEVREAIDLTEYASAHGIKNIGDVVSQTGMFGEAPRWSDGAVRLAELLRDGKPNDVVSAFRKYVNSKEPTMFGESTPAEAFRDAFGAEKPPAQPAQPTAAPVTEPSGTAAEVPESASAEPAPREPAGPTYMGSGFGALEPLFRESKAEGDRLRLARDEALKAANAAAAKPEEMKAGERVRAYLTSERDLWAARTNQAIDVVTRKVLPKMKDREALGIAREFRHRPMELQAFIDGTHPFFDVVDGGPVVADKNLAKLMPVMKQAARILAKPTARERAADAAFTNIAERDLQEGRKGGWLESRWLSDEYVPHALNLKGEGEVARAPSKAGSAMGKIGKYFGFGERRSDKYPTMVHAVADGIIPKTLDPSALFIVHSDGFARARATHLLEKHLVDSGLGVWGDSRSAPEGWVKLAAHTEEFTKRLAYAVPGSFDPESRESELKVGTTGLYVKPFIEKALAPITDPDYLDRIPGYAKIRTAQRGLKEAILGLSGFHLMTENFMAAADIGPAAMYRAFREPRESPATLANERDLIASGGTTSIQGSTMDAYRGLRPGTIPTRAEVVRAYIWGSKPVLELADAITRFTFNNVQRRFKVWSFALHRDAWIHDNPAGTPDQLAEAKKGIASYVNGTYGGLHWENMGIGRTMVGVSRLFLLAPDWGGSNIALAKYAFDSKPSADELPFRRRLAGAPTKESVQARLSRAFWTKIFVGALVSTQMFSLMVSGKLSKRPFQVYLGDDKDGNEIYQNLFFRGNVGDAVNLAGKIEDHAKEGYEKSGPLGLFTGTLLGFGVFVAGKAAPFAKLGMHVVTTRNDFGGPITPGQLATDVLPVPIIGRTLWNTTLGDDSDRYTWSERILSLLGAASQHIPPAGTHRGSDGTLRPNAERKTGRVYKSRGGR